ncbi:FliM/FliN family flagellar motor switch protein [Pendulispora albinea]|uniref:FliM/FliN family flagellar motor switch protein n=1 Tax=Pendulispora albinea TaxID=2741071 RepID=A0ABZ2LUS7_9BACT
MGSSARSSRSGSIRRFPWESLDGTSRRALDAMRGLRRLLGPDGTLEKMERALREILDARVDVRLHNVRDGARAVRSEPSAVTVVLEDETGAVRAWLEVEGALATQCAARAIRRPLVRTASLDPFAPPPETVYGAFAAVVVTTLRRGAGEHPLRIRKTDARVAVPQAEVLPDAVTATFTVVLEDEVFLARVAFDLRDPMLAPRGEPAWNRAELTALGDIPLAMPILASISIATVSEVSALTPGAAWIPGRFLVTRTGAHLTGPVVLCAPGSDRGLSATLGEDGTLVVGGSVEDLSMAREENILVENAGDIPVVVRVEVGSAEMRARDWASVRAGDVITLGRPVGSSVLLRVGGQEVARGELVDIEGELGVRILEEKG